MNDDNLSNKVAAGVAKYVLWPILVVAIWFGVEHGVIACLNHEPGLTPIIGVGVLAVITLWSWSTTSRSAETIRRG